MSNNSNKILIFSLAYIPFVGGAELAVKEITDRIGGYQFDLITLRFNKAWPKFEKIGNVNVYRIKSPKLLFPFLAFLKALGLSKKNNYCVAWSIMANRAGFAALFFKIFRPLIKFLLTLQEGDALYYPKQRAGALWPFVGFLFKRIFTKADYIQAISNYLADWAKQMGARCNIEVVPNGVSVKNYQFPNPNFQSKELKTKLNIKENDKILITTSRLVKKNAVGDVIEAMKYLPDNVKFLILGAGPLEEDLKLKIKDLKLDDRVILLGHIEPQEVLKYLAISDIFIRPSLSEGLGSSFLEAMAAGLPVIATPVGGIPDFLKDGETGLFCEARNPESIADRAILLLTDNELRKKIVNNCQQLIIEKYNWDLIAQKMKIVLDFLVRES